LGLVRVRVRVRVRLSGGTSSWAACTDQASLHGSDAAAST
jgi:hypothetical protein